MKYDFETIIDRDPAIRGTGKYRIMKDSKGNKPPKGIVPLSVADMEFRTAPCVIDAIKAEADFGVLGYHRLTDSFRESCCQWMKTRHDWDVQPDWIVPFEQVVPALYNAVWTFTQPGDGILIQTPDYHHFTGATVNTGRKVLENRLVADEKATIPWISTTSVRRPSRPSCSSSAPPRILPAASGRRRSCAGWARSATSTASWWWPTRSTTI